MAKIANYDFDWAELAFGSKKPINTLQAIFIAAPRELSAKRFAQLVKTYLPQGNIVLGLAKEDYVLGLEDQPQFKMLSATIVDKINHSNTKHNIYTLSYFQRDTRYILEKLDFKRVLLINGSWKQLFHTLPQYYVLTTRRIPYDMLSPFASEEEAREFEAKTSLPKLPTNGTFTTEEMLELAQKASTHSYDYGFQTGVTLGRRKGNTYELLASTFNKVVPFQTYAMHCGASREQNFSPMHDLNHYDTIHAEIALIIKAQKEEIDLRGTTLFINLLPCPTCARMLTQTDIAEFVYREDHSEGYAIKMLELAGKKVTRIVQ